MARKLCRQGSTNLRLDIKKEFLLRKSGKALEHGVQRSAGVTVLRGIQG